MVFLFRCILVALLAGLAVASPAGAATVAVQDGALVVDAGPGERNLLSVASGVGTVAVTDTGVAPTPLEGCQAAGAGRVMCAVPPLARGQIALQSGDPAAATALHTEALAVTDAIDNDHLRAQVDDLLGLDAMAAGDLAGARSRFVDAAEVHGRLLDQEGSGYCLDGFASIAFAQGRPEVAARLIGAAAHAREVVGVAVWPAMQPLALALVAAVRGALGDSAYEAATGEGAAMHITDALSYARRATAPEPEKDS